MKLELHPRRSKCEPVREQKRDTSAQTLGLNGKLCDLLLIISSAMKDKRPCTSNEMSQVALTRSGTNSFYSTTVQQLLIVHVLYCQAHVAGSHSVVHSLLWLLLVNKLFVGLL